ncbi:NAD(P)H-hydrate dehydratase [Sediminibacterium ginsengisoli]|uniref:Bifunctional NAD(P)H-hydrate repair enzyme n=1 Tax=Sediminibacterium ginsengisoli TaxID=413434 RepID=A0A1T4JSU8_9BACT|nr:NAD(P)H-hydrate dehydratase [Sediminibacterium ginsengisoli]SJZ33184.1 NAD(P)H-hydrate epimerase [Sediminibacterium ginsengisoli]
MKLPDAQQLKAWDAYTIQQEPVSSTDLMERAAMACTGWLLTHFNNREFMIFCGKGNNGGDGLAIARLLLQHGCAVKIFLPQTANPVSADHAVNLLRLREAGGNAVEISTREELPHITQGIIVIDALYGSGMNRPLEGIVADIVNHLNNSEAVVVSIDLPSGMLVHESSVGRLMVKAAYTLSFQVYKLCFMAAANAAFFGRLVVLDIGLHPLFLHQLDTVYSMTTKEKTVSLLKDRDAFSHKGTHGHALLIAGNKGKAGAAILAARACLRTGAGLLTVDAAETIIDILQTAVPEAMTKDRREKAFSNRFSAIGAGPGMGTGKEETDLLTGLLNDTDQPLILDADALTILSVHKQLLEQLPPGTILTPHPKEFDRVFGACSHEFDRWNRAVALSVRYPFVIVLKGHHTLIAWQGKGMFNNTGNAGMAKGGSGDVLTGMLTALLAQGYTAHDAAILGVWLHGLAGDLALMQQQSLESLLPSDLIDSIGAAFNSLRG